MLCKFVDKLIRLFELDDLVVNIFECNQSFFTVSK